MRTATRAYAVLCAVLGLVLVLAGLGLLAAFLRFHAPGGLGLELLPMGPNGHYFAAFAGSALVAWGGCLLGAARDPEHARAVGSATAVGLLLGALHRMAAWLVGDYATLGHLLRAEAALLLVLALALVWLRPPRLGAAA